MITTILLCGGRGIRLRPFTDTIPKPLIPLNGTPILGHVLSYYQKNDFNRIIICTGYRGDTIQSYVRENFEDVRLEFSDSGEDASMLRRLYDVRQLMTDTVIVAYGDTLVNVDLENMIADHRVREALVTITGAYVVSPWGLYTTNIDDKVLSFREKPRQLYYVGQFVVQRSVLENIDMGLVDLPDGQGLIRLFQQLISEGRLYHRIYEGPQITFNTHDELQLAEKEIINFYTQ